MVLMCFGFMRHLHVTLVIVGTVLLAMSQSGRLKGDGLLMSSSQLAHKHNCKLAVESHIDAQRGLVLRYTFHNDTDQDIYLFNRLYKEIQAGPVFDTDPNLVNIENLPEGILLSKKVIAVPPDLDVEKPLLPCLSLVKAGSSLSETIHLPLPLSVWNPYADNPAQASSQVVRRKARFELGYFIPSTAAKSLVQPVKTKHGPAFYLDPFPVSNQKTLEAEISQEISIHGFPDH